MIALVLAVFAGLAGCSSAAQPETSTTTSTEASPSADTGTWPRTITHPLGTTTIEAQPTKIVSTSVVLTGTLLALDAPVIGSGASAPNTTGAARAWTPTASSRTGATSPANGASSRCTPTPSSTWRPSSRPTPT